MRGARRVPGEARRYNSSNPQWRISGGIAWATFYLVLAYGLLWSIFTLYAWVIQRWQQRLEKELAELKRALGQQ